MALTIIDDLCDDSLLEDFIQHKLPRLCKPGAKEEKESLVEQVRKITAGIREGTYRFRPVCRLEIPKPNGDKRIIYTSNRERYDAEHTVLRLFAILLQRYDHLFSDNLYSFRNEGGVQKAIARMRGIEDIGSKYAYKADITRYFNSVDKDMMLNVMRRSNVEKGVCDLIYGILSEPMVVSNGELVEDDEKGIMPGMPFSTFLSNLFLADMDRHFHDNKVQYYRFADDILILADSEKELKKHRTYVKRTIKRKGLDINPKKEIFYKPHDRIEFLGLYIQDGVFDINARALRRTMGKVRSDGRAYRKMVERGEKSDDDAVHCFVSIVGIRFFGPKGRPDRSWTGWYFPLINTSESLKAIDHCVQEWARFVKTGKHSKKNRDSISYEELRECGYRTLVNRFYDRNYKS